MALTFEQLIGAGGTLAPRGAEEGEPTPTELKTTPTRPLWGSTPLARLSAPTLGQRLGEMLIKTTRAKYEERWAAVEQELSLAYETDSARLKALQGERERLLKHLQGMDKELQEIAVARAKGGGDGAESGAAAMMNAVTRRGEVADTSQRAWAEMRLDKSREIREEYTLSPKHIEVIDQIDAGMAGVTDAQFEDYIRSWSPQLAVVASGGATEQQRIKFAADLHTAALAKGISPDLAARVIGQATVVAADMVGAEPLQRDLDLRLIREVDSKLRGGARFQDVASDSAEAKRAKDQQDKAEEVNAWAMSPEGMAVLAALGDDGTIDNEEAAALAQARNDTVEEKTSDSAAWPPWTQGQITPDQARRESLDAARRYAVLASTPGIGDLVSTDVRRTLDPRRLETLAELSALGEEEDALRAGMVAPTYRNIAAGVQRERIEARDTRRAISGMKQEAREVGQAAAQDERRVQRVMGDISPQGVREAREAGRGSVMGKTTGLDPNATPEQRRFAQAMARAVQAGAWQERDVLPKSADAMYKLYEKGLLRDPAEAVKKAIELSPDDPDSVLVPYLQRVNRRLQDRDAQPIEP